MGISGPIAKSAEVRTLEGERAHRPLPAPSSYASGVPDRPKGMTARGRQVWDGYVEQLGPMGVLRILDGFALRRLCEDVALLEELQKGMRGLAAEKKRAAKANGTKLAGGALVDIAMSTEGRRLAATINALASRIKRDEQQFGMTPVASQRLENLAVMPSPVTGAGALDPVESALCG